MQVTYTTHMQTYKQYIKHIKTTYNIHNTYKKHTNLYKHIEHQYNLIKSCLKHINTITGLITTYVDTYDTCNNAMNNKFKAVKHLHITYNNLVKTT